MFSMYEYISGIHYYDLKNCTVYCVPVRDGNGPGRPRAGPGLKIQARGPHGPKRA